MRIALITTTIIFLTLLGVTINLGGCEARYRYPCQNPTNWGKAECHNSACKVEGSCTEQVLGEYYLPSDNKTEKVLPDNDDGKRDLSKNSNKNSMKNPPKMQQKLPDSKPDISNNSDTGNRASVVSVPSEKPLTMNTVVDTHEHNLAAN